MAGRRSRLENGIVAVLQQALDEGRLDVGEHLLRALEVLDGDGAPGRRSPRPTPSSRA
jgi:hypothetical protein